MYGRCGVTSVRVQYFAETSAALKSCILEHLEASNISTNAVNIRRP
jgi:hypothetical protein